MKDKQQIKRDDILDDINEFEEHLTDLVMDLHSLKGMTTRRQSVIFYRKLLWEIRDKVLKL